MPPILFAMGSYQSRSLPISAQRLVNMFLENQKPQQAKSQIPVFGTFGLTQFAACGTGPVRGLWTLNGGLYAVSGQNFYAVNQNGTAMQVGAGIFGTAPVSMSDNGTQIIIVNGVNGWIYDLVNGLRKIVSPAFYPADTVTFFDNVFVLNRKDTNQWFISDILDGYSYSGLNFASAEASSKNLVGIAQNIQLLFLFSEEHIEVWYDAGTLDFPFQRYAGGVIWRGCKAPLSIIKQDMAIYFLGNDLSFYRLRGNEPERVSTHAIDHIIAQDPAPENAFCFVNSIEGHKFIHLTLPASNHTLTYDAVTNEWHEKESWNASNVNLFRWRGNCSIEAYGETFIGDAYDGVISKVDWDVFTERGNTIRTLQCSIPMHEDRKRIFLSRLELDWQTGTGLTTGQGSNPQIMLRKSKDGGLTWSIQQPWRSLGKIGAFVQRLRWLRQGQARQWVFEVTTTDPVRRTFIQAHADISIGM